MWCSARRAAHRQPDLSTLDGSNGFQINGETPYDRSGISVSSAGDVNGDGFDDLIVGAQGADPNGVSAAGSSYVIFGRAPDAAVTRVGSAASQPFSAGLSATPSAGVATTTAWAAEPAPTGCLAGPATTSCRAARAAIT